MAISNKILKLRNHSLKMDNVWIANTETPDNESNLPYDSSVKSSAKAGSITPFIEINGYIFNREEIGSFELDETGFIPTIICTLKDKTGAFTNKYYPSSSCLLQLYIKSSDPNLKAVRCDFIITNIMKTGSTNPHAASLGIGMGYLIEGIMNIPKLYQNATEFYNDTSYSSLFEIAKKLDLGFATNEVETNDSMCWIQPNTNYESVINEMTLHSYKDDMSFFVSYIDRYMNLTFLNMANMTEDGETDDIAFIAPSFIKNDWRTTSSGENDKGSSRTTKLMLSNFPGAKGSSNYINSYSIDSSQGKAMISNPNTKNVFYYDIQQSTDNKEKFVNYFVKPIRETMDSTDSVYQNEINIWEGLETGNVHDNYIFAKSNNTQNYIDLTKSVMRLTTEGANLNILRGMRIPVLIFRMNNISNTIQPQNTQEERDRIASEDGGGSMDAALTAYYVVNGMKIIFNPNNPGTNEAFYTELICVRSKWANNVEIIDYNK